MNKYILINQEAKGVLNADKVVGLIGTHTLIDYDVVTNTVTKLGFGDLVDNVWWTVF